MKKFIVCLCVLGALSACAEKEAEPTKSIDDVETSSVEVVKRPETSPGYPYRYYNGMSDFGILILESIL